MASLLPTLKFRGVDSSTGLALVGGKLYSYIAGTTTPLATYTDSSESTQNANPVILDSRGEANVWLANGSTYKFALYDSSDNLIWTVDNVTMFPNGIVTTDKLATNALAATAAGRLKMQDGFFAAGDSASLAKFADGFLAATDSARAKFADAFFEAGNAASLAKFEDGFMTRAKLEAVGQQVSSSCSLFSTTSTTDTDVTNLSVTITTTGRPVVIALISDESGNGATFVATATTTAAIVMAEFTILRGATEVSRVTVQNADGGTDAKTIIVPATSLHHIDVPAAGTYTYKVQARAGNTDSTARLDYAKLVAYELK